MFLNFIKQNLLLLEIHMLHSRTKLLMSLIKFRLVLYSEVGLHAKILVWNLVSRDKSTTPCFPQALGRHGATVLKKLLKTAIPRKLHLFMIKVVRAVSIADLPSGVSALLVL